MNLDIIPNGAIKRVHVSQNDVGRTLTFELFNNSTSYSVPSGATVKIQGTKPSGFGFSETCTVSGNVATIDTTEAMTDESGNIQTELSISYGDVVIGTSNFVLAVERNPHPSTTTDGSMDTIIPELTLLVNEVKGYAEEIEGTYHAYGSPWVASTVAEMTDTDKIYVYTGSESGYTNGNWYYYNGSSWVSGGVYNAVAVNTDTTLTQSGVSADAKAVGDLMTKGYYLHDVLDTLTFTKGWWNSEGNRYSSSNTIAVTSIQTATEDSVIMTDDQSAYRFTVYVWSEDDNSIIYLTWYDRNPVPIMKGSKYTLQLRYADTRDLNDSNIPTLKKHIHFYNIVSPNNTPYYSNVGYTSGNVVGNGTNIGNVNRFYADDDMVVGLYDYTTYKYSLFVWDDKNDYIVSHHYHDLTSDSIVNAGKWYTITTNGTDTTNIKNVKYIDEQVKKNMPIIEGLPLDVSNIRNRLIKLETTNSLPSYYDEYLLNKCATINSLLPTSGVQFAFITDTHINAYNTAGHGKAILNYLSKNTFVDTVVCGGDIYNGTYDNPPTGPVYAQGIRDAYDYVNPDNYCNVLFVAGNHDTGIDYQNGVASARIINDNVLAKNTAPIIKSLGKVVHDTNERLNFTVDDDYNNVRYIIFSGGLRGFDGAIDETYNNAFIWFGHALDSCPNNYTIIVFNHVIVTSSTATALDTFISQLATLCDEYNARSASTTPYASNDNTVFDYSNATGTVACWVGGHTHIDMSFASPNGIPFIVTTTDNAGAENANGLTRTIGTVTEHAIDVFTIDTANRTINCTRLGAGSDRTFTY